MYLTDQRIIERHDPETGELHLLETSKTFRTRVEPDRFFSIYIERLASLYGIKQLSDIKVMIALCELAQYDTGVIHLNKNVRRTIQTKTKVSPTNLSKNIKRLAELDLLKYEDGTVTINPRIFWKGSMKVRRDLLKVGGLSFKVELYEPEKN